MRNQRIGLLLLVLTTGLALGVLPAAPSAQAVRLAAHQVAAEPSATLELSRDSIRVDRTFDATGRVRDVPQGTEVQLQRGTGGTWTTVATTHTTSAAGAFALKKVTASETGAFLYRAVVPGTDVMSEYSWQFVTAEHARPIVSGYVQAGGPVAGSSVLIYLKDRTNPVRTTTSSNGYFLARLPALPKSLLVVATGGHGPTGRFKGTMTGFVAHPTTHDSFYVNPATSLMAAYRDTHPLATQATANSKIRRLLGLKSYHNLDWALGGRPEYFDGVQFLRTAAEHGGFDAYIARLVKRIDRERASVSFRQAAGTAAARAPRTGRPSPERKGSGSQSEAIAGLIGQGASGYLGVAAQGASVINATLGLMNFVGSLVGWSPSGGPTPGQILDAIDQVQSTLAQIKTQIANLSAQIQDDYNALALKSDEGAYDAQVEAVLDAMQDVTTVQEDYADYVNAQQIVANCIPVPAPTVTCTYSYLDYSTDPPATKTVSPYGSDVTAAINILPGDLQDYHNDIKALETDLGATTDVFHDALRPNVELLEPTTPAFDFLVNKYLDTTGQVVLPSGSSLMAGFAARVLTSQAWAYYLISAYEMSRNPSHGGTLDTISAGYLGSNYENWAPIADADEPPTTPTGAPAACPPSAPSTCKSGHLNDEMTYLQSVLPVPEWMAVDTNPGGLMYMSSSNVGLASTYLPVSAASRARCVAVLDFNTGYRDYPYWRPGGAAPSADSLVCTALADPLRALDTAMTTYGADQGSYWASAATQGEPPSTYSSGLDTGWSVVSQGELGTILPRLGALSYVTAQYYFNPGPAWFPDASLIDGGHGYYVVESTYEQCADANGGPQCSDSNQTYVGPVIDWMKLYFKTLSGADAICTWAVGQANGNSDPCFDMPVLVARPLQSGEVYVPVQ